MPRRSRKELLTEFHRLYDIFEVTLDIQDELYPDLFDRQLTITRARMLEWVDAKQATLSQAISGAREAINDTYETYHFGAKDQSPEESKIAEYFLTRYREITGRDYFADAGRADSMAKKIIKRGHVKSHEEFRLLNMFVSDVDQMSLNKEEYQTANRLMYTYEANASPETQRA